MTSDHDAMNLLFLLRLLLKITLVYIDKNHMMRNRRRIMFHEIFFVFLKLSV